jgi:hypothetical protein
MGRRACWQWGTGFGVLVALAIHGLSCQPPHPITTTVPAIAPPWFADVTQDVGLDFVHDCGSRPVDPYFMPQTVGSGVAIFDFDNDGRLDLYFLQNGGPDSGATNRLYRQTADGHFVDVSKGSGLDITGYGMGAAIGDVNNDGFADVLITEFGGVHLFLNNGNGTFTDVTKQAGLDNPLWGTSAAFVDYDRDSWLDLVLVNYVEFSPNAKCTGPDSSPDYCGPKAFPPQITKLYHNLGSSLHSSQGKVEGPRQAGPNPIRFEDVTLAAGLGRSPGPGLGVLCADFNGDRWPDFLIANDGKPNHLWINQKDGTFKEEAVLRGLAYNSMGQAEANMGIALADVDGDGLLDVFVTHLNEERHRLWKQGPRGQFQDRTVAAGLTKSDWFGTGFGTVLVDFDNDGAVDLALANGKVRRAKGFVPDAATVAALGPFWAQYADRHQLFANDGTGKFRDISAQNGAFCGRPSVGRGLAWADLNGDGGVDLVVTNVAAPARIFRNVAPQRGHWLLVQAVDPALHRDAYGAEVTVIAQGRRWLGLINPGSSYLCSNDPRAHFGLGAVASVDALVVVWPDGSEERFPGRAADQVIVLRKGEGQGVSP